MQEQEVSGATLPWEKVSYAVAAIVVAFVFALGMRVGRDLYRRQLLATLRAAWLELSRNHTRLGVPEAYLDGAKQALDHVRTHIED